MTAEEVTEKIWLHISGNGLSMNQARALTIELLKQWKTEREASLHYQLIQIKSMRTDNPAIVKAVKDALNA